MYCTRLKTPFSLQLKKQGNKKYIVSVRNVDTIFVTLVLASACACVGVVLTLTQTVGTSVFGLAASSVTIKIAFLPYMHYACVTS